MTTYSLEAEQGVLGALLNDNDSIDRIGSLKAEHFSRKDHQLIFNEICSQVSSGKQCDVISVYEQIDNKVSDALQYLHSLAQSSLSSANVGRHAEIIVDKAIKRALQTFFEEFNTDIAKNEKTAQILDKAASRIDALSSSKMMSKPQRLYDMLSGYVDILQSRIDGTIKPISVGFHELDKKLDGGIERGTLTIVAARPGMGKTGMGLALARNVSEWGSALFLSMEMPSAMINDRNIAAIAKVPVGWLKKPNEENTEMWNRLTSSFEKAKNMNLFIDDQTSCTMLEIKAKARSVKRNNGLDLLVIDQLSFITGANAENRAYELGEYTRGLINLAKELDIAVVLLHQLNRDCEKRPNKRPMLSDLASSGSIEQDASNVLFLYRDEMYYPDTPDRETCEVIIAKQRQGETGTVPLAYISNQTRFEDFSKKWEPPKAKKENGGSLWFD